MLFTELHTPSSFGLDELLASCWQLYFLKSITLDSSSYSAVACWVKYIFNFVSQSDRSITSLQVLQAGKVQSLEICGVGISLAKFAKVSEIVALCQCTRTAHRPGTDYH